MPSPDDYDYSHVLERTKQLDNYAVVFGGPGLCDVINKNDMLRGVEQTFVDLALDDPVGLRLIERRINIVLETTERTLDSAR